MTNNETSNQNQIASIVIKDGIVVYDGVIAAQYVANHDCVVWDNLAHPDSISGFDMHSEILSLGVTEAQIKESYISDARQDKAILDRA